MIDQRPALIARCADARDVARTIGCARTHDLPRAVRGGGHSGPGLGICEHGVVAELSLLNEITVNPETRTARVGGGCTWGQFKPSQWATSEHHSHRDKPPGCGGRNSGVIPGDFRAASSEALIMSVPRLRARCKR